LTAREVVVLPSITVSTMVAILDEPATVTPTLFFVMIVSFKNRRALPVVLAILMPFCVKPLIQHLLT